MEINPRDLHGMRQLMKEHGKSSNAYLGENENGESIEISIFEDNISVRTYQNNGWTRLNVYYEDGSSEELFEGKWNQ